MTHIILKIRTLIRIAALCLALAISQGCTESDPVVSTGLDSTYTIARMQLLRLSTPYSSGTIRWTATSPDRKQKLISTSADCLFVAADEGVWQLTLRITDGDETIQETSTINVVHEVVEYSPYLTEVYEYHPAPGQFVNKMPRWRSGDTAADMASKVADAICGQTEELISLGAYGGYVVMGFDHTVVNAAGNDFMIKGNSFYDDPESGVEAGSAEPGIVMVSIDANGNGLPDDPWYELAGSEYTSAATVHHYAIAYSRPDEGKTPVPDGQYITDSQYIGWSDSQGRSGYVMKNTEHTQSYWPEWIDEPVLSFRGTLLAPNAADLSGTGLYFRLFAYAWGYADNHPNSRADLCSFDIDWAVDAYGMPVYLPGIDFIKVYTAVNQYCNWIGETSTEICGATDLNLSR